MNQHLKLNPSTAFAVPSDLAAVRGFLAQHRCALPEAAWRLGGAAASARVHLLLEAVRDARQLTRTHCRQLVDLHRLLTLQNVGDPEQIETALFAEIDPDSRIVDEICLLSEALERLLHRLVDEAPLDAPPVAEVRDHLRQAA